MRTIPILVVRMVEFAYVFMPVIGHGIWQRTHAPIRYKYLQV